MGPGAKIKGRLLTIRRRFAPDASLRRPVIKARLGPANRILNLPYATRYFGASRPMGATDAHVCFGSSCDAVTYRPEAVVQHQRRRFSLNNVDRRIYIANRTIKNAVYHRRSVLLREIQQR